MKVECEATLGSIEDYMYILTMHIKSMYPEQEAKLDKLYGEGMNWINNMREYKDK
jgi:hypothetical protein